MFGLIYRCITCLSPTTTYHNFVTSHHEGQYAVTKVQVPALAGNSKFISYWPSLNKCNQLAGSYLRVVEVYARFTLRDHDEGRGNAN